MTRNMGTTDRVIRMLVAMGVAILYFTDRINGILAIVLGAIAVAFVLSSLVGVCPAYLLFGWSTCGKPSSTAEGA